MIEPRRAAPVECHTDVEELDIDGVLGGSFESALARLGEGTATADGFRERVKRATSRASRAQDPLAIAKASTQLRTATESAFSSESGARIYEMPFDAYGGAEILLQNSFHMRCCELKAEVAGGIDWLLEPPPGIKPEDGPEQTARIKALFADPSGDERQINDLARAVFFDIESLGNGYIEITRDEIDEPSAMYHAAALTMRVAIGGGFWQVTVLGGTSWERRFFKSYGDPQDYDGKTGQPLARVEVDRRRRSEDPVEHDSVATEIIHLKQYHPMSATYGIPTWIPAALAMRTYRAGAEYNADRFEYQTIPNKVIVFHGLIPDEKTKKKIADYFEIGLKGRTHKPLVLSTPGIEEGQKIEVIDLKRGTSSVAEEGDFHILGEFTRDETIMVHGVPSSMIGVVTPGKLGSKGESETARRDFKSFKIEPRQTSFERAIQRLIIVDGFGVEERALVFKLMDFDLSDHEFALSKSREMRSQVGTGIRTINEARRELGLPLSDIPAASELWVQTSSGPLLLVWIDPKTPPPNIFGAAPPAPATDNQVEGVVRAALDEGLEAIEERLVAQMHRNGGGHR